MKHETCEKKSLDTYQLIVLIKTNIQNGVTTDNGKPFFGNITMNFQNGRLVIIEKHETIK